MNIQKSHNIFQAADTIIGINRTCGIHPSSAPYYVRTKRVKPSYSMSYQLSDEQKKFLELMLFLQNVDRFNNGLQSLIKGVLENGKYSVDDQHYLQQLTVQYSWWLRETEKGNSPGTHAHLDIKLKKKKLV
jgi:hypothetical protein